MSTPAPVLLPEGKRFAFTIMDDTDVATVANVGPIYRLLEQLGMRTTKTVWPVACPEGSPNFSSSETLEDPEYRTFVLGLQRLGFEIAFHGATMESSQRSRTEAALRTFRDTFGVAPRVHANHSFNRENIYWGPDRLDAPLVKWLYRQTNGQADGFYLGHVEGSPYWWGDLAQRDLTYVRNLSFDTINVLRHNPTLPYRDSTRPLARWWFSASDAEDCSEFNRLISVDRQEELESEGGVCIVATHLGKGFCRDGQVNPQTVRLLTSLSERPGWFVPVGQLLDWLVVSGRGRDLPSVEWAAMQRRWLWDLVVRKVRHRLGKKLSRAVRVS